MIMFCYIFSRSVNLVLRVLTLSINLGLYVLLENHQSIKLQKTML